MTLTRKTILIDGFREFRLIGSAAGGMGKVYFFEPADEVPVELSPLRRVTQPFTGKIAIKFALSSSDSEAFERECRIWLKLRHKHIVPLLKLTNIGGQMAALMPLYHQNLESLLDESERHDFRINSFWYQQFSGICEALNHAWQKFRLLHLDLKPQNILNHCQEQVPYLSIADWGMSRFQDYCFLKSISKKSLRSGIHSLNEYGGTVPYMSPERLLGTLKNNGYTHKITDDIFSLGIIMIEIATRFNPCVQGCPSQQEVLENILTGRYFLKVDEASKKHPSPWVNLAKICCHPESSRRPKNYKQIIKQLKYYVV